MNAMVDLLVEAQHEAIDAAPRPRMVARRIGREQGTCLYSTFPPMYSVMATGWNTKGVELPRGHHQARPDYGNLFITSDSEQAMRAVEGYLFTGAAFVTLDWGQFGVWHQEVWVAS